MPTYFHINYELERQQVLQRIDACCARREEADLGVTQPQRSENGRSRYRACLAGRERTYLPK